ncbi:hypothetical protein [Paraburkholderia tropica]|uniref:hypothetical protein n=1 Tax=Paraburkholderia tropica TaxID=92647 RepID=UPI002AB0D2A8|nr:hypothetical protein [Paraburkholderia tropica]
MTHSNIVSGCCEAVSPARPACAAGSFAVHHEYGAVEVLAAHGDLREIHYLTDRSLGQPLRSGDFSTKPVHGTTSVHVSSLISRWPLEDPGQDQLVTATLIDTGTGSR